MKRLLGPGFLIYAAIVYRAWHQSVTIDEADSFDSFADNDFSFCFYPSSGNHVLNTILIHIFIRAFGIFHLTLRSGALLGAAIYLVAAAYLATRISTRFAVQLLGCAILTLNPFVLDYLVAARGYALAMGFLAAALGFAFKILLDLPAPRDTILYAAALSICCGLSLTANFSFSIGILSMIGAFLAILLMLPWPLRQRMFTAAAATLPGAATVALLVGRTLRAYPRDHLTFGAANWAESFSDFAAAVFPSKNLSLLSAPVDKILEASQRPASYLILIPVLIALWQALAKQNRPLRLVWLALAFALTGHSLARWLFNLPLPLDRTGLFLILFMSLLAIQSAASAPASVARVVSRVILSGAVLLFLLAFRTTYFRMWEFNLDTDRALAKLILYQKAHPHDRMATAGCTFHFNGVYNFYRKAWQADLPECEAIDEFHPPPRRIYLRPFRNDFIEKAHLDVIYEGPLSWMIVGIAPKDSSPPPPATPAH